jgi:fructose-1,6-bisphosphatase
LGERQLAMEDIYLTNLGDRQTGLSAEELANVLLTPVVDAARKKVNNELRNEAKDKLQENLEENLSDDDKQKLDKLKSWLDK